MLDLCALTGNVNAHNFARHHMIGQHSDQLVFILRLQKVFDGAFRQGRESFVGRSKHCKGAFAFLHIDQAGGCTAATSVEKLPAATAVSTISCALAGKLVKAIGMMANNARVMRCTCVRKTSDKTSGKTNSGLCSGRCSLTDHKNISAQRTHGEFSLSPPGKVNRMLYRTFPLLRAGVRPLS